MKSRPLLAVTMGDPSGIGTEIGIKTALHSEIREICDLVFVGDANLYLKAAQDTGLLDCRNMIGAIDNIDEWNSCDSRIKVLHTPVSDSENFSYGKVRREYGLAAAESIESSVDLAMKGKVEGVVTAPINKEALALAGVPYPGHTEMLAALTGTSKTFLMLAIEGFRVSHATLHMSLRQAVEALDLNRVRDAIMKTNDGVKALGIRKPRLAVCALNPHAGEGGLFGTEEADFIIPAIKECTSQGLNVEGPYPADSVFAMLKGGRYDAVVTMYHDQGGIPMKLLGFQWDTEADRWGAVRGVNITLGLPIIRTSVAHGTAFDAAGKGVASAESLMDAVRCAVQMADTRRREKV